jgi:hypothetical protein
LLRDTQFFKLRQSAGMSLNHREFALYQGLLEKKANFMPKIVYNKKIQSATEESQF